MNKAKNAGMRKGCITLTAHQRLMKAVQQERDEALAAIRDVCRHCGYDGTDTCAETMCRFHSWQKRGRA